MTHTYRGKYYLPSSNSTPPIPPYSVDNKRKEVPKEKSNEELPAGIGDAYYFSPLIIGDDLKMDDMSGGNCSMESHTLYQHDCNSNNGNSSSGYVSINSHNLY